MWFFGILASSFGTLVGKYMPYLNIAFGVLVILMGINYLGINFPLDYCGNCKTTGIFEKKCSCCGSAEIKKLRRVSGYLSYKETLKGGKKAEEKLRKSHFKCEWKVSY